MECHPISDQNSRTHRCDRTGNSSYGSPGTLGLVCLSTGAVIQGCYKSSLSRSSCYEIADRSGSPLMENAQPITPRPAAYSCKNRRSTGSASQAPPIANARERLSFFAVGLTGIMSQIRLTWFHPHIPQGISARPAQSRNSADRRAISKRSAPRKGHRTCR